MTTGGDSHWLLNGEPSDAAAPDRGMQFGDGVFETLAAIDGRIPALDRHLERLARGCQVLGLPIPDKQSLRRDLDAVLPAMGSAVLKILITADAGGRGYARSKQCPVSRRVGRLPWPAERPETFAITLCRLRLASQPLLAGIKHCNRLEQILARREVDDAGADEGLLLDSEGHVVEGVSANLFVVHQGGLQTPVIDECGVAGIMRARVLETAERIELSAQVTRLSLADILDADEIFMTNSLIGIRPVHRLSYEGSVREWQAGAITDHIQQEMADR